METPEHGVDVEPRVSEQRSQMLFVAEAEAIALLPLPAVGIHLVGAEVDQSAGLVDPGGLVPVMTRALGKLDRPETAFLRPVLPTTRTWIACIERQLPARWHVGGDVAEGAAQFPVLEDRLHHVRGHDRGIEPLVRADRAGVAEDPFDPVGARFLPSGEDRCLVGIHTGHGRTRSGDGQGESARAAAEIQDSSIGTGQMADPDLVPELLVTDVSRSISFWCDLCGFEIRYDTLTSLSAGDETLGTSLGILGPAAAMLALAVPPGTSADD